MRSLNPLFRWSVNHTVAVQQPLELFALHLTEVGT
jgi:hypothetical protein